MMQKDICGWDGYLWENGDIRLGIVPQLGGRIMSLQYRGEEIFFVQEEHCGEIFDFKELAVDKKVFGFRVWGGDKTWLAPERMWIDKIPPLDLDAGRYCFVFDGKKVTMTSAVCRETGLQVIREIELVDDNRVVLTETVANKKTFPIRRGIWNVAQVVRPVDIYIKSAKENIRLYEGADYQNCRPDDYLYEEGSWTKVVCRDQEHFKFGVLVGQGQIAVLKHKPDEVVVFSKIFPVDIKAEYAHGSSIEVYNSPTRNYCEVEVHSPLVTLDPQQSFSQRQQWFFGAFPAHRAVADILKGF